jgi:hypothetical protein
VSPAPAPQALARLRALLLDAASGAGLLPRQALESFQSWQDLAALLGSEWSDGLLRSSVAARRVLARRLRGLGAAPVPIARAAELPAGTPIHLRGTARPVLPSRLNAHISHIWSRSAMTGDNVRTTVEEGHDFFVVDGEGATARVIAARGYLLNADLLQAGDLVSVFGFTDTAPAASGVDSRAASLLAVRAGDDVPLIVQRLQRLRPAAP